MGDPVVLADILTWVLFSMILVLDLLHRNFLGLGNVLGQVSILFGHRQSERACKDVRSRKDRFVIFKKICELLENDLGTLHHPT